MRVGMSRTWREIGDFRSYRYQFLGRRGKAPLPGQLVRIGFYGVERDARLRHAAARQSEERGESCGGCQKTESRRRHGSTPGCVCRVLCGCPKRRLPKTMASRLQAGDAIVADTEPQLSNCAEDALQPRRAAVQAEPFPAASQWLRAGRPAVRISRPARCAGRNARCCSHPAR